MEYAGDNAVSNSAGRGKEPSSLATDAVRSTLAALFSRHGLSGAAGILMKSQGKDSGTVPAPPVLHTGYSGNAQSENKGTDSPEGLPIATTYNSRVDVGDGEIRQSPAPVDRSAYPPVLMTGMVPRGRGRGWGPAPRQTMPPNPPLLRPNFPPPGIESIPPMYTRPPPPIRPMNPRGGGRGGGKYKPWNAQGHSTNR